MTSEPSGPTPLDGRSCGACMMCCKLSSIKSLGKPSGKWCQHATTGKGCRIYNDRPDECGAFFCDWMLNPNLGPDWKPSASKFYIQSRSDRDISILVDPGSPGAWREPRFYNSIKPWAARAFELGGLLTVHVGHRVTIVLPDRDIDAGIVPDYHVVRLASTFENGGKTYRVIIEPPASDTI